MIVTHDYARNGINGINECFELLFPIFVIEPAKMPSQCDVSPLAAKETLCSASLGSFHSHAQFFLHYCCFFCVCDYFRSSKWEKVSHTQIKFVDLYQ